MTCLTLLPSHHPKSSNVQTLYGSGVVSDPSSISANHGLEQSPLWNAEPMQIAAKHFLLICLMIWVKFLFPFFDQCNLIYPFGLDLMIEVDFFLLNRF